MATSADASGQGGPAAADGAPAVAYAGPANGAGSSAPVVEVATLRRVDAPVAAGAGPAHTASIAVLNYLSEDAAHRTPPLRAGTDIHVRIWSDDPMDLHNVRFDVSHALWRPNVSDEAYAAYARSEDRRGAEEIAQHAREVAARERDCASRHDDESCWGRGGYGGAVARAQTEQYCSSHIGSARCGAPGETALADAPDGPPPAPRAEVRPPQPSAHAEWAPGY